MSSSTGIEWTDATWNPVRGCSRVSPGCGGPGPHGGCYAEVMAARFSGPGQWGEGFAAMKTGDHRWTGKVELIESQLILPLHWKKPRRIFVNSTSDLFHEKLSDDAIDRVFAVIAMCPQHTFQVLTKRPERMRHYVTTKERGFIIGGESHIEKSQPPMETWSDITARRQARERIAARELLSRWPLPNVWLGTSVEDQERADERIPHLLATPAAVRFLSCEPLLGPIDLSAIRFAEDDAEIRLNTLTAEAW